MEHDAGSVPLGAYIRTQLFAGGGTPRPQRRRPASDDKLLAQLLGSLGESRIASNLNQLARAANCGALYLTPDEAESLRDACMAVVAMRRTLMQALGLERGERP